MASRFLIIGAGFSGAVLANRLVNMLDCTIDVWDERAHIAGNCHTQKDAETGVMEHTFGPHIFHTDKKEIWDFVNSFAEFRPYVNRVKARYKDNIYSLPVNLHTINQFFGKSFNPEEAREFINEQSDKTIDEPANFEEQAMKFIGKDLYKAFFYGYTKKQWGCEPSELPASILKRLPLRFNYDDNYYNSPYQGIPVKGYTYLIEQLLDNDRITVVLNKKFVLTEELLKSYDHIFYTGAIDALMDYKFGRLSYRTVTFEKFTATGDHQGSALINYCDESTPFTRIHEHKHFTPWEKFDKTIYFKEYSKETGPDDVPYYPKRLQNDKEKLQLYRKEAMEMPKLSLLGRLATYRYLDMHQVIGEAIAFAENFATALKNGDPLPVFTNVE